MSEKTLFIISKGLSIKEITEFFSDSESSTLKRRKIGCMFGIFVTLQSKAKRKKYLHCFRG